MRIYSPSPTVRASRTPLYLMGISNRLMLGQDVIDTSAIDTTGPDLSTMFEPAISPIETTIPTTAPEIPMTTFSPQPGFFDATPPELQPLIAQGFTVDEADLIASAAANGQINETQFQQILSGEIPKSEIANTVFAGYTPTTGPTQAQAHLTSAQIAAAAQAAKTASTLVKAVVPGPSPRVSATPRGTTVPTVASVLSQPGVGGLSIGALLLVGGGLLLLSSRR